ncbi:g5527 [Coccomyxa elongata]
MTTLLTPNSGLTLGMHQTMDPMEDRVVRQILKETRSRAIPKGPAEQKEKRSRKQDDASNGLGYSPPRSAPKKAQEELEKNGRSATSKKAAAAKSTAVPSKQASALALKHNGQPASIATSKQQPDMPQQGPAARCNRKDTVLRKQASAPGTLPVPQQPSEPPQFRGFPTATTPATSSAPIGQSGPPKVGSAVNTCTGSSSLQDLRSPLLTKWAGPGFSLPPTPDALPMPSASLLACKKKGTS